MKTMLIVLVIFLFAACAAGYCAIVDRLASRPRPQPMKGKASYYGEAYRGKRMANGERFDPDSRTCASYAFELGTILRVTSLHTRRAVLVTVTDRGPALRLQRLIDLSQRAFADIADLRLGVIDVECEVIAPAEQPAEEKIYGAAVALPVPK